MRPFVAWAAILVLWPVFSFANVHQLRVPLKDGKLHLADVAATLSNDLYLPHELAGALRAAGTINVRGIGGSLCIAALNKSLGDGFSLHVSDHALLIRFDPDKLPRNWRATRSVIRTFVAEDHPAETAAQRKYYGLHLLGSLDPNEPLVVLIPGLDCDGGGLDSLRNLLRHDGRQVAIFGYPDDGPIDDDIALLQHDLATLHQRCPQLKIDLIAHSMGGLIARGYVEGDGYAGSVDRLILLAPPNGGSNWARFEFLGDITEHVDLARSDKHWHWTWMITDGLGEAADDLMPHSKFLKALNSRTRRAGVRYTIIAGDQPIACRLGADCVAAPVKWIPAFASDWWGVRQSRSGLQSAAARLRNRTGESDGPVSLKSARLSGVSDFVVLRADHTALYYGVDGKPPVAWETIKNRLSN